MVLTATSRLCGKAGGLEPPAHDYLLLGVEADGIFAVGVEVAEEGVLPTGEGEERHRGGDAYVDADHADFAAGTVLAGALAAGGEDGVFTRMTESTGPKISSRAMVISGAHFWAGRSTTAYGEGSLQLCAPPMYTRV